MSRKPLPGRLLPVVYALALHAVIAAVLVFRFEHAPTPITGGPQVEPVQAEVIDEQLIADELKRLREREEQQLEKERKRIEQLEKEAESARLRRVKEERRIAELEKNQRERELREARRLAEITRKRKAQAKLLAVTKAQQREAAEKKRRSEEQAQLAEAARVRAETELRKAEARTKQRKARDEAEKRKAEEEQRRKEADLARQAEITREERQLEQERLTLLNAERTEYIAQIRNKIERNWLRPPNAAGKLTCVVRVSQIPGGEVVRAEITTSSGSLVFDRSVEEAVLRSSPLPAPKDPLLFDRDIVITFEPEG